MRTLATIQGYQGEGAAGGPGRPGEADSGGRRSTAVLRLGLREAETTVSGTGAAGIHQSSDTKRTLSVRLVTSAYVIRMSVRVPKGAPTQSEESLLPTNASRWRRFTKY